MIPTAPLQPPAATMRAALCADYGNVNDVLTVQDGYPTPDLKDVLLKNKINPKLYHRYMLIKVDAVALAPGDCRTLSGLTRALQGPPSFPYIPGGDCCGVVLQLPPGVQGRKSASDTKDVLPFDIGDRVAVRFCEFSRGALGEYAVVRTDIAARVPPYDASAKQDTAEFKFSSVGAAALASASPAVKLCDSMKLDPKKDRILILGAGGGIGSHLCQLLQRVRNVPAAHIVGVSCTPDRITQPPLNCGGAIDYSLSDPFDVNNSLQLLPRTDPSLAISAPYDVIVDLGSGGWLRLRQHVLKSKLPSIVKPASQGGRFYTISGDTA
jgi:NADPH:quinone reductase-like Zn-dependent oxidoreductase